jgi:molybdopterin-containing oxidoreductase family molybdopterin binding subunit
MDCGCRTTIFAHVRDGVLVKVEPADFPDSDYRYICGRGLCTPRLVYHPDRLKYPLKRIGERGEGKWQRISWDEALDTIAHKYEEIQGKYGRESLAWATWAMGAQSALSPIYLRFANACEGTFIMMIGPGDSAGPCGDVTSYGNSRGQLITIDFDNPELVVLWGDNATVTEPWSWARIRRDKEKGTKVVVIDPLFTPTASKADQWLSIRPGTDTALALGMMNVIINRGLQDEPFIHKNTVAPLLVRCDNGMFIRAKDIGTGKSTDEFLVFDINNNRAEIPDVPGVVASLRGTYNVNGIECKPAFQLLVEMVERYSPEKVSEITGASPDIIERLALEYATKKPVASYTGWGVQRTFHGDLAWRAITTLAAITGNISLNGVREFMLNRAGFTEVEGKAGKRIPLLQMYEAIMTGKPHPIKALWIAKHNFVNQGPNMNKVLKELLPRLEFVVTADMFMNASAQYSDIVLPACTQFEFTDLIVPQPHCHTYMLLQQKVIEPLYESKPDLDILTELAKRMGLGEFFEKDAEGYIEQLLDSGHPSMQGSTLERLKKGPIPLPEHRIPAFNTPSGRFEFYSEKLKKFGQELPVYIEPLESARKPLAKKYPLTLLTTHSRFRAHSQFANIPWLKELDPEPLVEMNPADAKKRGIKDRDIARVFNDRGYVKLKAKVHEGIMPGIVNIPQGWEPVSYIEGHHQTLTHDVINEAQLSVFVPNPAYYDILVEVEKNKEK